MNEHAPAPPYPIPDVQGLSDARRVAIAQVGVRGVRHPLRIATADGPQSTVATVDMSVSLPHDRKGTHMSRFLDLLHREQQPVDPAGFAALLRAVIQRLDAQRARVLFRFPYFRTKAAPVTGIASLMDYEVELTGDAHGDHVDITLQVRVPVTTLCPCSKEISDYGAHNQRSHVTIRARTGGAFWIDDAVDLAESRASSQLYGILKRADEKFVTERAYDNPRFVEDLVRDVAAGLRADARLSDWTVEVENHESIHNHSAWAVVHSHEAASRDSTAD